jgi:CO/xanthine dehydrogenase Mo-binding subunit/aerobic-type carbon monoxide dehydrogenase small subunit (CoxS/CutS family)
MPMSDRPLDDPVESPVPTVTTIDVTVNRQHTTTQVNTRAVVADFVRDQLGLTGTKISCGTQVCGACTVLIDDAPVSGCTYLAADLDGRTLETVEGLAIDGDLHPLQQAFIDHWALQCGFCTPGFLMAAKALLADNPDPSRDEVLHALEGNICRCTGYLPIIDAVLDAARVMRDGPDTGPEAPDPDAPATPATRAGAQIAGVAVARVDGRAKVTGAADYAIDFRPPDVLEGLAVRSDRAHARVLRIDAKAALAVPGCVAVVTGADLADLYPRFGHVIPDHQILALDKVRYYGEPVALVVAEDRYTAADAAALVEVEYEDLDEVMTSAQALADDAPEVHDQTYSGDSIVARNPEDEATLPRNVAFVANREWGDVDAALATAPHVVETSTFHPMLYAYAMEPYVAVARFTGDVLEVTCGAQHPFMVVRDLARVFSLPHSRIRVSVPFIGGGYGSKSYTKVEPLAAVGAWCTGRAVRVALTVEESIYTTRADSAEVTVRSGFDNDGHLLARDFDVVLDTGAYADNSPQVLQKAVNRCFGAYRIPNLRVRGRLVYTNTSPASSYRALGAFQTNLAGETNIDQAAQRLDIDPAELRRRNLVHRGEEFIRGRRRMDADLVADFDELTTRLQLEPHEGLLQGIGFGCGANEGGSQPSSTAQVKVASDGSAIVLSGSTEMGQGSRTILTQIAAQELGLPMDRVRTIQSDSATTSFERTTGASRTTTMSGLAVLRASHDALRKLCEMAAENWECPTEVVQAAGGVVVHDDGRIQTYEETIRQWFGSGGGEVTGLGVVRRAGHLAELPAFWEIGMVGVAIDIDPETGATVVDQLVTVADVGFALNPAGVEGQDLGAAVQGLGGAFSEELIYDGPQIRNANLIEYRVPRTIDGPRRYEAFIAQRGDGPGPYGAKGVGEGARIPMGGAVAAAVARAIGVWPDRLPLTPERIWRLLQQSIREGTFPGPTPAPPSQ